MIWEVAKEEEGQRLDKYLSEQIMISVVPIWENVFRRAVFLLTEKKARPL